MKKISIPCILLLLNSMIIKQTFSEENFDYQIENNNSPNANYSLTIRYPSYKNMDYFSSINIYITIGAKSSLIKTTTLQSTNYVVNNISAGTTYSIKFLAYHPQFQDQEECTLSNSSGKITSNVVATVGNCRDVNLITSQ